MARPIDDPRSFAVVLGDWMARHSMGLQATARFFGASNYSVIAKWLDGGRVTYEPALRRAMTHLDDAT